MSTSDCECVCMLWFYTVFKLRRQHAKCFCFQYLKQWPVFLLFCACLRLVFLGSRVGRPSGGHCGSSWPAGGVRKRRCPAEDECWPETSEIWGRCCTGKEGSGVCRSSWILLCYPRDHSVYTGGTPPLPAPGFPLCGGHQWVRYGRWKTVLTWTNFLQSVPSSLPPWCAKQ